MELENRRPVALDNSSDTSNIVGMLFTNLKIGNARLAKYVSYLAFQFENFQANDKVELEEELLNDSLISDEKLEYLKSVNYQSIFAESLVTAVNNSIENNSTEIIKANLRLYDRKKDDITIPLIEFEWNDLETIKSKYHGRYIDLKLLNLNFYDKLKFLIDEVGFIELNKEPIKQSLLQLRDLRNLISHNNSKITESFYANYSSQFGEIGETLTLSLNRIYSIFYLGARIQLLLEVLTIFQFADSDEDDIATDLLVSINDILLGIHPRVIRDRSLWSNFTIETNLSLYLEIIDVVINRCKKKFRYSVTLFEPIKGFVSLAYFATINEDFAKSKVFISNTEFSETIRKVLPEECQGLLVVQNNFELRSWFKSINIESIIASPDTRNHFGISLITVLILLNDIFEPSE